MSTHPLIQIIRKTIIESVINDAFHKWFDGSKVVDADGNPQVVHHGTSKKFTRFNLKNAPQPIIWFTSNRASIEAGEVGAAGRGHIMDLYVSMKNPAGRKEYEKYGLGQLKGLGYDGAILPGEGGFDGFVFDSAQLKSVANRGEWDPSNKNILKEEGVEDFKYDAVKKAIQAAINNGNMLPDDITPNKYFIVGFDFWNKYLFSASAFDKPSALEIVKNWKNDESVCKIYVEKPTVDAVVFLRKEHGWIKK